MSASALGVLLRYLREERRFSLRELAQLAKIDHSYIHKLEAGDKESPSEDVLSRLIKVLKPGAREVQMMQFLARNPDADPEVTEYALKDTSVGLDIFAAVAVMRHRGNVRKDPKTLIDRVRQILEEK